MRRARPRLVAAGLACAAAGAACTPTVGHDTPPEAMEFDPDVSPPRVPEPPGIILNQQTGLLDFGLAGINVPADCAAQKPAMGETAMPQAQCEFYQYLEALDGFPTVTPARTPATAVLDTATLTLGQNVVVAHARNKPGAVTDVTVGFDADNRYLTVRPNKSWAVDDFFWIGVRGYAGGVRAASGSEVVGSPTMALLKQETPLTCAVMDASCPAYALLAQMRPPEVAAATVVQLEGIRQAYRAGGGWDLMAAMGLPKSEVAVLWGFPTHRGSVAAIDPTVGLVPAVTAPDEVRVAVQGDLQPDTVKAFVLGMQTGSVLLMDLTEAAGGNLQTGIPHMTASYNGGEIVMKGEAPFAVGHMFGVFLNRSILSANGAPLVPSPVSVLLTFQGPLRADGHSTVSTVSDADSVALEAGRQQLAALFDDRTFGLLTGITRASVAYCFAFPFQPR